MVNVLIAGESYLPECTVVTQLIKLYAISKTDSDPRFRAFMGEGDDLAKNFRDMIDVSLRRLPHDAVLKDPYLTLNLKDWRDLFKEDRMIVVVRDPRDVVSSMLTVLRKERAKANVAEAVDFIAPFYSEIEKIRRTAMPNLLFVRYEDLVGRAPDAMKKLSDFVGRDLNVSGEESSVDSPYLKDTSNPYHSKLYGRPVTDERIGAYADTLTEGELKVVQDKLADALDAWYADRVGKQFHKSRLQRLGAKTSRELARLRRRMVRS
jgi:hypothetical protein